MVRAFLNLIDRINTDFKENITKTLIVFLVLIATYFILRNIFASLMISFAVASFIFNWDSRFFIGFALVFLVSCPFLLVFDKETIAKEVAVYAYYLFAISMILQFIQYIKKLISSARAKKRSEEIKSLDSWNK